MSRGGAGDGVRGAASPAGARPVLEGEAGPQRPVDAVGVEVPAVTAALAPHGPAQPPLQGGVVVPLRGLADLDRVRLVPGQDAQAAHYVLDPALDNENDRRVP